MRAWPLLALLLLAVGGCDGAASAGGGAGQEVVEQVGAPPNDVPAGKLAVYKDVLDSDDKGLSLGSPIDRAHEEFPAPDKGILPTPLPKGLPSDGYSAAGWELADGTAGAGFILNFKNKSIVAALIREQAADSAEADRIVSAYTDRFQPLQPTRFVFGPNTYLFWDDDANRMMILESPAKRDRVQLTLALGIKPVMAALRADPDHARRDGEKVVAELSQEGKGAPSGSP